MSEFWIGTSGFQYPEWKGGFYPEKMPTAKMLGYYSAEFSSTEINYTFRSLPSAKTIGRWHDETPGNFRFSLKAPQKVTHFAKLRDYGETLEVFHAAVAGLGDKLGPVLFQLPPTFKEDAGLLGEFLAAVPAGFRIAFEFRHESWFTDEVFETLEKRNAALCIAESGDLSTPRVATADFGYLRPRREDYSDRQLADLATFVREQAGRWQHVFGYFKHEETGVGPRFAKTFLKALGK